MKTQNNYDKNKIVKFKVNIQQCYDPNNDIFDLLGINEITSFEVAEMKKNDKLAIVEQKISEGNSIYAKERDAILNAWRTYNNDTLRKAYLRKRKVHKNISKKQVYYTVPINLTYDPNNDFYTYLGIDPSDTKEDIQEAIISASDEALTNSDIVTDNTNEMINKAHIITSDEELKSAYDKIREEYKNLAENNVDTYNDSKKANAVKVVEQKEGKETAVKAVKVIAGIATAGLLAYTIGYCLTSCSKHPEIITTEPYEYEDENTISENEIVSANEVEVVEEVQDVNIYTDPFNENQVYARATLTEAYLVASNVNNIYAEDLEEQIKFLGGAYPATSISDAYDTLNNTMETFATYGGNLYQGTNFAAGIVSENGIHNTIPLIGMLPDNTPNYDLMVETYILWTNVLTAPTQEEKYNASIEYLKQATELELGLLVDKTGTNRSYMTLDANEGFIYGCMFHIAYRDIVASLGENYKISIQANNGEYVNFGIKETWYFYNPQCNENDNDLNAWAHYCNELVEQSLILGQDYTLEEEQGVSLTLTPNSEN